MHHKNGKQQGKDTFSMAIVLCVCFMLMLVVSGVEHFVGVRDLQVSLHSSAPRAELFSQHDIDQLLHNPDKLRIVDQQLLLFDGTNKAAHLLPQYEFFNILHNPSRNRMGFVLKDPEVELTYAVLMDSVTGMFRTFGPLKGVSLVPYFRGAQLLLTITRGAHSYDMILDL